MIFNPVVQSGGGGKTSKITINISGWITNSFDCLHIEYIDGNLCASITEFSKGETNFDSVINTVIHFRSNFSTSVPTLTADYGAEPIVLEGIEGQVFKITGDAYLHN